MNNILLTKELYLSRIGYSGPMEPTSTVLRDVQYAHIHSVPYENLDILRGIPLSLEIPDLYDKIVLRRRGGYCFELNRLFGWLLLSMGFTVTDYFARFLRGESVDFPKRRHHVLRVETEDGPYLCDVGVGSGVSKVPLRLRLHEIQEFAGETYRLENDEALGWVVEEMHQGAWRRVYSFTEEEQHANDYDAINYFCQYAPESIFRGKAMVSLTTHTGRNTVAGDEFRIFSNGEVRVFTPEKGAEWENALREHFGIVLQ